jgi:hypothetical protein
MVSAMLKAYQYIYYRLYAWNRKLWGDSDVPEYNAAIGMSLMVLCNFLSLNIVFNLLTDKFIAPPGLPKIYHVLIILVLYVIHYLLFIRNKKYLDIVRNFQSEDEKERKRNGVLVFLYSVGSPLFFIFLMFFGIWLKH